MSYLFAFSNKEKEVVTKHSLDSQLLTASIGESNVVDNTPGICWSQTQSVFSCNAITTVQMVDLFGVYLSAREHRGFKAINCIAYNFANVDRLSKLFERQFSSKFIIMW